MQAQTLISLGCNGLYAHNFGVAILLGDCLAARQDFKDKSPIDPNLWTEDGYEESQAAYRHSVQNMHDTACRNKVKQQHRV